MFDELHLLGLDFKGTTTRHLEYVLDLRRMNLDLRNEEVANREEIMHGPSYRPQPVSQKRLTPYTKPIQYKLRFQLLERKIINRPFAICLSSVTKSASDRYLSDM